MQTRRQYSALDRIILGFEEILGSNFHTNARIFSQNPADPLPEVKLPEASRRLSASLMRINHAGEVSAQALYQGQGFTARSVRVREAMLEAAREESDHLLWCRQRLRELATHPSYLNPVWYTGSFSLGVLAGVFGDKWSLGFVAETEHQVVRHLDSHLARLPEGDLKSRAILEQMKLDEARHATAAMESGAAELPVVVRKLMSWCSLIMTRTAYWL